jgi:hypothetical protein
MAVAKAWVGNPDVACCQPGCLSALRYMTQLKTDQATLNKDLDVLKAAVEAFITLGDLKQVRISCPVLLCVASLVYVVSRYL